MHTKILKLGLAGLTGAVLVAGTIAAEALPNRDYQGTPLETMTVVHPYGAVRVTQLIGRINGQVDPQKFTSSETVNFADLNLNHPVGWTILRQRVTNAAVRECTDIQEAIGTLPAFGDDSMRDCVRPAVSDAMAHVRADVVAG